MWKFISSYIIQGLKKKKRNDCSLESCVVCEGNILASGLVYSGEFAQPFLGFSWVSLRTKYIPKVRVWFLPSPLNKEKPLTPD